MTTDMHWNSPSLLPPVDCPLLICIGNPRSSHIELRVERTTHLTDRNGQMEYRSCTTGALYRGRFAWTYP